MRITNYELMEIFETAAEKFLRYEYELVEMKCNERTLCSQLSHYIRQEMEGNTFFKNKDYHCDIEYSRNCANPTKDYKAKKMLNNSGTNFYADIIIHSRGKYKVDANLNNLDNILVIEAKYDSNPGNDIFRLSTLTEPYSLSNNRLIDGLPEYVCGYDLGVQLIFYPKDVSLGITYWKENQIIDERIIKHNLIGNTI